jgi:ketosteroid isomerase-like protein
MVIHIKKTLLPLALASLVAGVSLVGCAASAARSTAADEAAIADFNRRYLAAINAGDSATLASLTTADHMMIASGRPPIVGKKANDEANARVARMVKIDETWTPEETVISGDLAYQRGTFTVGATPKSGGATTHTSGNFLRIYRKQPNGEWRMTRDMFNTAQPAKQN